MAAFVLDTAFVLDSMPCAGHSVDVLTVTLTWRDRLDRTIRVACGIVSACAGCCRHELRAMLLCAVHVNTGRLQVRRQGTDA
jgi:hypothetical protein